MDLQKWIAATIKAASRGNPVFLPTVGSVDPGEVRILDRIPSGVPHHEALQQWIGKLGLGEYYFAVAEGADIVVGHCARDTEFARLEKGPDGWKSRPIPKPAWWRLGAG